MVRIGGARINGSEDGVFPPGPLGSYVARRNLLPFHSECAKISSVVRALHQVSRMILLAIRKTGYVRSRRDVLFWIERGSSRSDHSSLPRVPVRVARSATEAMIID
jgi:hypothetical protein